MTANNEKFYIVEPNLESYRSFFDHEWARRMFDIADHTALSRSTFNLCEAWKGAANNAMLPWLVIHSLGQFAEGYSNRQQPYALRFLDALRSKLAALISPRLFNSQQQSLLIALETIDRDLLTTLRANPYHFDRQQAWSDMLDTSEFSIAVLASQRSSYASVYYAYEDFLISCFCHAAHRIRYRIRRSFLEELTKTYDANLSTFCWSDQQVRVPRLVRHAIVHNGARISPELETIQHGIQVIDGALQITPQLTRSAFDGLKSRAMLLLSATLSKMARPADAIV